MLGVYLMVPLGLLRIHLVTCSKERYERKGTEVV